MASILSSCLIHLVSSRVRPRELPPAPYVTETKSGLSWRSDSRASPRTRSPASVLGGKNSNEKIGSSAAAMISSIRIGEPYHNLDRGMSRLASRFTG